MGLDPLVTAGTITEIVGPLGSGRTSLLVACLRDVTQAAGVAALIDADDVFDPAGASRAGVVLERMLWVRGNGRRDAALRATDLLVRCPGFALVALDAGESPPAISLAAAFRWRQAVRRAGAALLLLGRRRVLGAGATVCVAAERTAVAWRGPARTPSRLAGMRSRLHVVRNQRVAQCEMSRIPAVSSQALSASGARWWCA